MVNAGYSGTPLVRKLGLKQGMRIILLGPPEHYWDLLAGSAATLGLDQIELDSGEKADFIHLFATNPDVLQQAFASARSSLKENGMVWASWPKKSSGIASGIGRSQVMAAGKKVGLVDIKVCAVDETWSGLKFVIPTEKRMKQGTGVG